MILYILGAFIVVLAGMSIWFYWRNKMIRSDIKEVSKQFSKKMNLEETEIVQMISDEQSIQELLVQINTLLDKQKSFQNKQQKLNESNRKMLANISHDLKTPLTIISGYSEMLLQNEDVKSDEEIRNKVERIYKQTNQVSSTVSKFFDLAKLDAEEYNLKKDIVDLGELCRKEILNYHELLTDSNFEVVISIPDTPVYMLGDEDALKRVLSNLLSNAIRYGSDGNYLKIELKVEDTKILLSVSDKGIGISEDNYEKIFERLFTLDDSRNRNYQGSGLGLTITKHLTEAMNGKISLYSESYKETTFTLQFPLYQAYK